MNTPPQLGDEGNKAYAAFDTYVQQGDNRSTGKVARQLSKSRQLITRWSSKHRWQARIAAQRLRECEQRIQAEERAVDKVATWTEATRAEAANRALDMADKLNDAAQWFVERSRNLALSLAERKLASDNAAKFFVASRDVLLSGIGGAATSYNVPIAVTTVEQWIGEGAPPKEIETLEDAERTIAEYEGAHLPPELPCDNWDASSPDSTPVTPAPEIKEPEATLIPEPEQPKTGVPMRGGSSVPTKDNQRSRPKVYGV
jgi:hypothetical protein